MGGILDRGSLLFATVSVLLVSLLGRRLPFSFYVPLFLLAIVYVPGMLLAGKLLAAMGAGIDATFQRDYSPLLGCSAMAFTAAGLPLAVVNWVLPWLNVGFWAVAAVYFLFLMFFAVRTVLGAGNGIAIAMVCLSVPLLLAGPFLLLPLRFLLGWLASPFFLFYAYYYLGGELSGLGESLRRRQHFHRTLEAAAVNPHDADAQYQLGLIYQQRRQYSEAIQRFEKAVAIDPSSTDAHFQLGRIARQQGRLKDALQRFQTVVNQDEKHSQNEILRELGALYLSVRQYADARNELATYVERRPYDPEGLFYYGQALEGIGKIDLAREMFQRAIESARTAPRYRRPSLARWSRLARKRLMQVVPEK